MNRYDILLNLIVLIYISNANMNCFEIYLYNLGKQLF